MKKITKAQARKLYQSGKPFIMCASKLNPTMFGVKIDRYNEDFDQLVNAFYYYNCNYTETGRSIRYYTEAA